MAWILNVDHLFSYIMEKKLNEFNVVLAAEKGLKIKTVTQLDDFSELERFQRLPIHG